jgi:lipopolysaccharide biosynthesis glycosyltransferase
MKNHWDIPDYINSGVMLINLIRWRELDYTKKCIEFSNKNIDKLILLDQCAINVILQNDIVLLSGKWNVMVQPRILTYDGPDASILHFITDSKPWQSWYEHPLGESYWRYLNVSPWADAKPIAAQTVSQVLRLARLLAQQGKLTESIAVYERFKYA